MKKRVRRHGRAMAGRRTAGAAALALCLCVGLGLSSCAAQDPSAAAVIGDTPIPEEEVTAYVEAYRLMEPDRSSDEDWAAYLRDSGQTAADMREAVIGHYAEMIAELDDAERRGVALPSEEEIEAEIARRQENYVANADYYAGTYQVNSWDEFKQRVYVSDYNLRLSLTRELIQDAYRAAVEADLPVEDDRYEEFLYSFGSYYHAKRFSRILCADEATADEALATLGSGEPWADVARRFSLDEETKEQGGDAGWDILNPSLSQEEIEALRTLSPDEASGAIALSDGRFEIVKCIDEFNVPEDRESFSLEAVPAEIVEYLRTRFLDDAFDEYVKGLVAGDALRVNEMPSGLPYDVTTGEEG